MWTILKRFFRGTFGLNEAVEVMETNDNLTRRETQVGKSFLKASGVVDSIAKDVKNKKNDLYSTQQSAQEIKDAQKAVDRAKESFHKTAQKAEETYERQVEEAAQERKETVLKASAKYKQLADAMQKQIDSAKEKNGINGI